MINKFDTLHNDYMRWWKYRYPDDNSNNGELTFDCSKDVCILETPADTPVQTRYETVTYIDLNGVEHKVQAEVKYYGPFSDPKFTIAIPNVPEVKGECYCESLL